jgi:hypothetical protein
MGTDRKVQTAKLLSGASLIAILAGACTSSVSSIDRAGAMGGAGGTGGTGGVGGGTGAVSGISNGGGGAGGIGTGGCGGYYQGLTTFPLYTGSCSDEGLVTLKNVQQAICCGACAPGCQRQVCRCISQGWVCDCAPCEDRGSALPVDVPGVACTCNRQGLSVCGTIGPDAGVDVADQTDMSDAFD